MFDIDWRSGNSVYDDIEEEKTLMANKPKPEDSDEWTPGPSNPESGGGEGMKTRSKAEDDFRKKFDKEQGHSEEE